MSSWVALASALVCVLVIVGPSVVVLGEEVELLGFALDGGFGVPQGRGQAAQLCL